MGCNVFAEEEPKGNNRTIEDNLVDKLENIIENTVVCVSSGLSIVRLSFPPYTTLHYDCELYPFEEWHNAQNR